MCIFMDMIKKGGEYIYPSIRVTCKDATEKIFNFVEYVYVDNNHLTITRVGKDIHEDVVINNVNFFTVVNE